MRPILVGVVGHEHRERLRQLGVGVRPSRHAGDGPDRVGLRDAWRRASPLAVFLWVVVVRARAIGGRRAFTTSPVTLDTARMWQLVRLGTPAALQLALEVGVFAAAAALAGRISPVALAANQMVLNIAGFFFMVPFGLSSAAAVRVGQAVGPRRSRRRAARRVVRRSAVATRRASIVAACSFVLDSASRSSVVHGRPDRAGGWPSPCCWCAPCFSRSTGFRRSRRARFAALGDTRTPMLFNLAGHWLVGLPVGYALCFWSGLGRRRALGRACRSA